ncbi:MAG: response regulator [Desulfonatronovibrionaceae bacterium]
MAKRILVIDDEKHIRMLYQEELESHGYKVFTSDGSDSVGSLLSRSDPDAVILDIKLGGEQSGLDILQEIRARDNDVPVILCTAYDSFQHDLKSIAADYYVVKSVDLTELMDKVKKAIAGSGK